MHEFERTVTNVGDGVCSYSAKLTSMNGIKVKVGPPTLVFKYKYEKLRYKLSVEGPRVMENDVVFGSVSWVDGGGKYVVRSPIVATKLQPWHS